jgi:tetratricopeptide (TPR) repeat protein
MKYFLAACACLLSSVAAAHGQHSLAMHTHSGTGSGSACKRFDGPIELYPPEQAGDLNHTVSTKNPRAQQFFNQGLTFFYGFDSESAMRSFHQAAKEDHDLAMAYWGVALAAGGDLNIPINDPCMRLAREQIEIAKGLLARATQPEQLYIQALAERYAILSGPGVDTPRGDPQQLGVYYALAMKAVYKRLGSLDPDAGALYVYSLMNLRPWQWWTTDGQAAAEITEARKVLEAGLHTFPRHIGLNHIYIHAMEEGPIALAVRAKAAADFLFNNAPVITPHLRHMPAHTYLLLGKWDLVIDANQRAVDADDPWAKACRGDDDPSVKTCKASEASISAPKCNQLLVGHYYSHDMLFLAVGYNNRGEWDTVQRISTCLEDNVRSFIGTQPGLEHYLTTKEMMMVHFGEWRMPTVLPPPQSDMPSFNSPSYCTDLKYKLAAAMWYFGRAMGHASLKEPTDDDVQGFQLAQGCVQGAGLGWGNNSASDILKVAHWRMLERIAREKGDKAASQMFALLAVETEDLLDYDEPPGWYLSSRETYGAALYLAGDHARALKVFREDLKRHPNNSRSLFGVWQALKKLGASAAAAKAEELFKQQWKRADLPNMADM